MLIIAVCLLGSCLVWVVVLNKPQLRSPMNYLLLNMSMSDIVSSLSLYPYLFIVDPTKLTSSNVILSKLCMLTEGLTPFFVASATSLLTLCAISFNRYMAVKYPIDQSLRMGRRAVLIFSGLAWVFGLVCMIPGMISFKWDDKFKTCARNWGLIRSTPYRLSIMLLGLVLPMSFLLLSYFGIFMKAREIIPFNEPMANTFWRTRMQLRKAEKMLGVLILVYIICWFPFLTYWLLATVSNYFPATLQGMQSSLRWLRITVLFCSLNGALNPFVYTLGSSDLKKDMKSVARSAIQRVTCRTGARVHPATEVRIQ